jgi:hypothetical protein
MHFGPDAGQQTNHFGPFATTTFNNPNGTTFTAPQFTSASVNTQLLALNFAAAGNYYSDPEESDAGHQFTASGTATDYTEKTLLVKSGRGLLVNKNFEPEDYLEAGYIFNNAVRNSVSFKELRRFDADRGYRYGDKFSNYLKRSNQRQSRLSYKCQSAHELW